MKSTRVLEVRRAIIFVSCSLSYQIKFEGTGPPQCLFYFELQLQLSCNVLRLSFPHLSREDESKFMQLDLGYQEAQSIRASDNNKCSDNQKKHPGK